MPAADHLVFDELMPNTIVRKTFTGFDKNGKPVTSTQTTYKCLYDDNLGVTRNSQFELVSYSRTAYVNNNGDNFSNDDIFEFDDGTPSRPLVSIHKYYDVDGAINNIVLRFG